MVPHNLILQVIPDHEFSGDALGISRNIGTEFTGPGFYLNDTITILILPHPSMDGPHDPLTVWHTAQPHEDFRAYVWNVPISQTIFSMVAVAPVRKDERTL